MKYANTTTVSRFFCTACGNEGVPIVRKQGQQREGGHLKRLFCLHCKKETNHAEIRPFGSYSYEDFLLEFSTGRFLEDGTRIPVKDLPSCKCVKCYCNQHGKCWNSNGSMGERCLTIKNAYAFGDEKLINLATGYTEIEEEEE